MTHVTSIAKRRRLPIPPDRGELMSDERVAAEVFGGLVTPLWVRRNVPNKVHVGHRTKMWFERDVYAYAESRRESA